MLKYYKILLLLPILLLISCGKYVNINNFFISNNTPVSTKCTVANNVLNINSNDVVSTFEDSGSLSFTFVSISNIYFYKEYSFDWHTPCDSLFGYYNTNNITITIYSNDVIISQGNWTIETL